MKRRTNLTDKELRKVNKFAFLALALVAIFVMATEPAAPEARKLATTWAAMKETKSTPEGGGVHQAPSFPPDVYFVFTKGYYVSYYTKNSCVMELIPAATGARQIKIGAQMKQFSFNQACKVTLAETTTAAKSWCQQLPDKRAIFVCQGAAWTLTTLACWASNKDVHDSAVEAGIRDWLKKNRPGAVYKGWSVAK